jgi:energy-coupling factor transporter ATP-binding protein EcfA2
MFWRKRKNKNPLISTLLQRHFSTASLHELVTAVRVFPATARVDLQAALDEIFPLFAEVDTLVGLHSPYAHDTITFSHLTVVEGYPVLVSPLQYDEVETGNPQPVRCLKSGLWLVRRKAMTFCVLLTAVMKYGSARGAQLELAVGPGLEGVELTRDFFKEIEQRIQRAGSYRGKVLSLEVTDEYSGRSAGIKVHRLPTVTREEVILPEKTLTLLERNITRFVRHRSAMKELNLSIKKGLLFYGAPGTGKTHTIQYLASQMPDHTTLLITAEQVGLLDEYMQLARFLQPVMVVLEDVDLIARSRTSMRGPCEESLLNRLLNEMDGLREDAAVLFVLTTNRPEELEAALASRPGRVDQAIEFPLPDEMGRRRLVHLYRREAAVSAELVETIVQRTAKASASFLKELMRRAAQNAIEGGSPQEIRPPDIESALDEMLFTGGSLNAKLVGIATSDIDP